MEGPYGRITVSQAAKVRRPGTSLAMRSATGMRVAGGTANRNPYSLANVDAKRNTTFVKPSKLFRNDSKTAEDNKIFELLKKQDKN